MAVANLVIEIPPAIEPVSLALAKQHCRVSLALDDELFGIFIAAARELVEGYTGRSYVNKGYRQEHHAFPYDVDSNQWIRNRRRNASNAQFDFSQMIKLRRVPVVDVAYIDYTKPDGTIGKLYPKLDRWQAESIYALGSRIKDSVGNIQICTTATPSGPMGAAVSGAEEPTWTTDANTPVEDEDLEWTYQGPTISEDFVVDKSDEPAAIFPAVGKYWPPTQASARAVRIHFTAGYGADALSMFPAVAKVAMMQSIGNWNENRENVTDAELKAIPNHFEDLLAEVKVTDYDPTPG